MRYYGIAVLTRIVLAVFAFPDAVSAQAVARTFDELNVRVRSGETVHVTDNQSRTINGLLLTISADALVMEAASGRVTLSVAQVDRVRVRRRDSLKNGILGGLAAGAAGGALVAMLTEGHDRPSTHCTFFCDGFFSTGQVIAAGMLVGGVLGIGAGAAIDAVIKERRLVYEKASGAPQTRLVIAPLVRRGGAGVVAIVHQRSAHRANARSNRLPNERLQPAASV